MHVTSQGAAALDLADVLVVADARPLTRSATIAPLGLQGVWRNYEMCTAYSMVDPPGSETGTPIVCFNPYLETGLTGLDGTHSNCMTCHQMAAWPNFSTDYVANGFVSPSDAGLRRQPEARLPVVDHPRALNWPPMRQSAHHEGHEEHEGRTKLRDLRALRW